MLSRVADSLYWMSRYLERAEHTARVLDVNLHGGLDQRREEPERRWRRVIRSLSVPVPEGGLSDPHALADRLTFDPTHPGSVVSCIVSARKNAREVREQISTEMWEQLNRLQLLVQRTRQRRPSDGQSYEFFQSIKQGSHLFQGIASTTLSREDGWYFIQLGRYLERVTATVNLLDAHLAPQAEPEDPMASADQYLEWVGLLKSCAALEAYWRVHTANIVAPKGMAFLLLDADFPHSVRFGIDTVRVSLDALSAEIPALKRSDVHRRLGKLLSTLSFDREEEIVGPNVQLLLASIRAGCRDVHNAIYEACISYPVEHAVSV
jgi:uncharacterized alpha-E superfamily protein